ncbi:MAG: PDGLE domain-containing protein [Candidatus Brocadia sinica]|nr:PDGLE domain-containing protein [Candidatus Brocadia sinica]NUO05328.1 PDGLE domain-containing protein [Candidatus Brocadia sinica]
MNLSKKNIVLFLIFGLSFIVGLIFLIIPFVSEMPDGLEKVSEETMGFLKKDDFKLILKAPMPDYTMPAAKQRFNRQYAGIIGVFIVFGVTVFVGYILKKRRKNL